MPERLGVDLVQEVEPREVRRRPALASLGVMVLSPGAGRHVFAALAEHVGQLAAESTASRWDVDLVREAAFGILAGAVAIGGAHGGRLTHVWSKETLQKLRQRYPWRLRRLLGGCYVSILNRRSIWRYMHSISAR
jgi:hypothetical protein